MGSIETEQVMSEFQIQPLSEIHADAWAEARCQLWPSGERESHENEIRDFLRSDSFRAWGAWISSELVGFIEVYLRPFANGCESRPVPFVEGIWVRSSFRKNGVSAALLREAEQWAKAGGFSEIGSDADIDNELSYNVHRKWGFEETERVVYFRKSLNK